MQGGRLYHTWPYLWWCLVWPDRDANPRPTAWEADTPTANHNKWFKIYVCILWYENILKECISQLRCRFTKQWPSTSIRTPNIFFSKAKLVYIHCVHGRSSWQVGLFRLVVRGPFCQRSVCIRRVKRPLTLQTREAGHIDSTLLPLPSFGWFVGWLCFTSHRQRCLLETASPFTVPCEGHEVRFL